MPMATMYDTAKWTDFSEWCDPKITVTGSYFFTSEVNECNKIPVLSDMQECCSKEVEKQKCISIKRKYS